MLLVYFEENSTAEQLNETALGLKDQQVLDVKSYAHLFSKSVETLRAQLTEKGDGAELIWDKVSAVNALGCLPSKVWLPAWSSELMFPAAVRNNSLPLTGWKFFLIEPYLAWWKMQSKQSSWTTLPHMELARFWKLRSSSNSHGFRGKIHCESLFNKLCWYEGGGAMLEYPSFLIVTSKCRTLKPIGCDQ